jgi:hypothetical protein
MPNDETNLFGEKTTFGGFRGKISKRTHDNKITQGQTTCG